MTNDGNAILREISPIQHPAAKHMIEIARTQVEEVSIVLNWLTCGT